MRPALAIIGLGVAALASPPVASPAYATAFDATDAADDAAPSGAIERHTVWTFKCFANKTGVPYLVGTDARDGSLQVKAEGVWTYYGHIDQLAPTVFEMRASRPDPFGWIVLHAAGPASWLKTKWGRDECQTLGGFDASGSL
jgi:hypothetical protein